MRFAVLCVFLIFFSINVCAQNEGFFGRLFEGFFGGGCRVSEAEYNELVSTIEKLRLKVSELEKNCGNDTENQEDIPPQQGACCISEETPMRCVDSSFKTECQTLGGEFFLGRDCSNLTSSECSSARPTGSCCHPKISYVDETGIYPVRCLDSLTEHKCGLLQGSWGQSMHCSALGQACPPYGACCYSEDGQYKCANNNLETNCHQLSGTFTPEKQCDEVECQAPQAPTGSCCHPKISYVDENGIHPVRCLDSLTEHKCGLLQGSWGQSMHCSALGQACPPYGACCYSEDGQYKCANNNLETNCHQLAGTFNPEKKCDNRGYKTPSLQQNKKPVDSGACCAIKVDRAECIDSMMKEECTNIGGEFHQDKECNQVRCEILAEPEPEGACCIMYENRVECREWVSQDECLKMGGEFTVYMSCDEIKCVDLERKEGACCIREDDSAYCREWVSQDECVKMGGEFSPLITCQETGCEKDSHILKGYMAGFVKPLETQMQTTTTLKKLISANLIKK